MSAFNVRHIVVASFLIFSSFAVQAQPTGQVQYIPNGSFEELSVPQENVLGATWAWKYGQYSRFWRQFHRYTVEPGVNPITTPMTVDRVYDKLGLRYDPVSCSSSDLFSIHLDDCVPNTGTSGSGFDIPENMYGFEPLRVPPGAGQPNHGRYAGLYYRLNGIRQLPGGGYTTDLPFEDPATDYWREYLEVELLRPLEAGKIYNFSFWVSRAEMSNYFLRLQARFTTQPYYTNTLDNCDANITDNEDEKSRVSIPVSLDLAPTIVSTETEIGKVGWTEIKMDIKAKGGERYLTIGNFDPNPIKYDDGVVQGPPVCKPGYYTRPERAPRRAFFYIDDVSLTREAPCECGLTACVFLATLPHVAGQPCCFKVSIINGHRQDPNQDIPKSCPIYEIKGYDVVTNNLVFSWSSSASQPIIADDVLREIGDPICVAEFSTFATKEFRFDVLGSDGTVLCSTTALTYGCGNDPCKCSRFGNSIEIKSKKQNGNDCCYTVAVDMTKLNSVGCSISSVRVYRGSTANACDEMQEARYTPSSPISPTFAGDLYSFCPTNPLGTPNRSYLVIEFRDAQGNVVCSQNEQVSCDCDCSSDHPSEITRLEGVIEPFTQNNKCCYRIKVRNRAQCKLELTSLSVSGLPATAVVTPSSGWVATPNGAGTTTTFVNTGTSVILYDNEFVIVGTFCQDVCEVSEPSTILLRAGVKAKGQQCQEFTISNAVTPSCPILIDCNAMQIEISPIPTYGQPDGRCCAVVLAKLDICDAAKNGLTYRITTSNGQTVPAVAVGKSTRWSFVTIVCKGATPMTITVELRRLDGAIVCTKTATLSGCPWLPPGEQRIGEKDREVGTLLALSGVIDNPSDSIFLASIWSIVDLQGNAIASSKSIQPNATLREVVEALPPGVFIVRGQASAESQAEIRSCHVLR